MTRREEREHIFKLLFLTEFYKEEELEQQEMRRSKKIWNRLTGRSMKRQRAGEQTVWGK